MISTIVEQARQPPAVRRPFATLLTMVESTPPMAFRTRPSYGYVQGGCQRVALIKGGPKADGEHWRRIVPSPQPKRIFELRRSVAVEHNTW
jgi:carbamate kinase